MRDSIAALSWTRIAAVALAAVGAITLFGSVYLRISSKVPGLGIPLQPELASAPPVASMRYLPTEVQLALVSLCDGCAFADSNGAWNATDVIDDRLPRRRLARTEKRGDAWLVEYEHGGFATFRYTVVLSASSKPRLLPGSSCLPEPARICKW